MLCKQLTDTEGTPVLKREHLKKISCFHRAFFKINHFYWPTNALNCTKLNRLKSTCINILKDN